MHMETRHPDALPVTAEQTKINSDCNGNINKNEGVANLHKIPHVYKEDVVRCNKSGMLGIVTGIAGDDSDSDSSLTDDETVYSDDEHVMKNEEDDVCDMNDDDNCDKIRGGVNGKNGSLPPDQVKVLWMDDSEKAQFVKDTTVVDRGFMHGDYIASASEPTGQVGVVVDVNIYVDLLAHDRSIIKDVSTRDLKRVRDLTYGDYVVLGPWLGRIDDVSDNVSVLFDDGSVCKVMRADISHLVPVNSSALDDGNFPYYPGQIVKVSSSTVFKNGRWLSGLWKANRLEGTVTKVTVGSVFVHWITSTGYGSEFSIAPAEEQSPKNLKHLSCFGHANWKLGDWCLFPSKALSSSTPLGKDVSKSEIRDSDQNKSGIAKPSHGDDSKMSASNESTEKNKYMGFDATSLVGTNGDIECNVSLESRASTSLSTVSKEYVSETRHLHQKKFRKVLARRDRKARKKEDSFERALVIINIRTKVDVAWQDGTTEHGLLSTTLIPIDNPGDHEFIAEQYVMEKASDDDSNEASKVRRVGVVRSVDAKGRTACVRWLKPVSGEEGPREFDAEEVVSVYELEGHIDFDYCYGDIVVRLSPVTVCAQTADHGEYAEGGELQTCPDEVNQHLGHDKAEDASTDTNLMDFSDLSWVGNITRLRNGDIEVMWADGMISTVGPQAVYVVVRDDDESIAVGTEASDDASWETMSGDEADTIEDFKESNRLQESGLENNIEINHESEYRAEPGGYNSERNGSRSIPLAAFHFVARLASEILSLGRKHLDSHSKSENELQSQVLTNLSEKGASSDDCSPQKYDANGYSSLQNAHGEPEDNVIAEAICDLRLEEPETLACSDDANGYKLFDISRDPVDHHFLCKSGQKSNERKWLKKVQQDWSILQNNLPEGIYVRVYEDRMDLLRALIVGSYGTPYQDGLFFFDFHLPPEYPNVPPSVYYHSGGWRINPNLYEEGKVCLSLLNTWHGKGNEVWDHASSSILQVLVSLQGLVLNSRPYFNEAGYNRQVGSGEGEKNSLAYNENTFLLNCKTMMFLMCRPPKDFEELVKEHFKRHAYYILKACDAYMKGCLIGSLAKDASTSDNSDSHSTSVGFKLILAKILPKLIAALNEVGADCIAFNHLNQT